MSSQEIPGASSSRGTAMPLEATTVTGNLGNRFEDFDIALGQTTAGDFKLDSLQEIDPEGDYKVQVSAPQHALPNPPVPDLACRSTSELYKEFTGEIVDQFYEAEFQRLEMLKRMRACENDLEDYYTTDDDDSSYLF